MSADLFPSLSEATECLQKILPLESRGKPLSWFVREDLCPIEGGFHFRASPSCNAGMFERYYEAGRIRGSAQVLAIFNAPEVVGCTIWCPEVGEVQGWESGLKVSVLDPLRKGLAVSGSLRWLACTALPRYRRFVSFTGFAPLRVEVLRAV